MDINSELATRTVAYLELLSELLAEKQALSSKQPPTLAELNAIWTAGKPAGGQPPQHPLLSGLPAALLPPDRLVPSAPLKERTAQLVASRRRLDPAAFPRPAENASLEARTEQYWQDFLVQGRALLWCLHAWQDRTPEEAEPVSHLLEQPEILPARWRRQLRRHLYAYPASRLQLAQCLDLLPALIHNLEEQQSTKRFSRLGQWLPLEWRPAAAELQGEVLTRQWALREDWLAHPEKLELVLEQTECAVPFEHVFAQELADVTARRTYQGQELPALAEPAPTPGAAAPPTPPGRSPWDIARHLKLRGLGLSGGGIRSASFNLGVLQAMAQAGALTELDYLSTVSGGGYIGSWLVAWMKRAGSAAKVQALLCPNKAPNPLSEETRPIRWLRSYSNYLAPRASAFSTDMWTIGVTWLRNTLLNQVVLALTLGAVLAMCYPLLLIWQSNTYLQPMTKAALGVSVALIPCVVIGRMLRRYALRRWGPRSGLTSTVLLTASLLVLGYLGSSYAYTLDLDRTDLLRPGIAILALLLLGLGVVIWFANYPSSSPEVPRWRLVSQLVLATILSALAGVALLYGAVELIQQMPGWQWASIAQQTPYPIHYNPPVYWPDGNTLLPRAFLMWTEKMAWVQHEKLSSARPTLPLAFVFGPPLVVEALALMVTLRMGLLGRYVPDDRREWWGRLGALMQLLLFAWILVTGTALVAPVLLMRLPAMGLALPATIGGWLLLVGKGVQWAQGALTPAQSSPTAAPRSPWRDLVARVVPYVFALGLLVLMSWGVAALLRRLSEPQPFSMAAALQVGGLGILLALGLAACLGVNEFSMHHFYRNRLVRAYLGASRAGVNRQPNPFTGFDGQDDLPLYTLGWQQSDRAPAGPAHAAHGKLYDGPIPIINVALNVSRGQDLANQDRKAESFVFTPRHCGFDFARLRPALEARAPHEYGYRPTYGYSAAEGPSLGSAMTISGAAVNPNMGYHSSSVTAFLLTVFNVRLGWWMGNPLGRAWRRAGPRRGLFYLLGDLFGRTSADDRYVNLSDGGHFDNLGLYELVRRRCQFIILSDSEEDAQLQFEGLGNAIRRCRIDFGVEIHLDPTSIGRAAGSQYSQVHVVRGRIIYPDWPKGQEGVLLYIKSSLTGDEPVDVRQFAAENATFPHQSTGDQFFTEPQLESYRQLGYHIARGAF